MIPQPGQHIKIIFRNNMVESGIVVLWSKEKSVLKALNSNNVLVIQKTDEDVMAYKICYEEKNLKPEVKQQKQEVHKPVFIDQELKVEERIPNEKLRAMKLVELHGMKAKEEKERVRRLLTSQRNEGLSPVEYGLPKKLQKPPKI